MPYDDGHFEKIYAIEATVYTTSLYSAYSEVFRALKPGGMFALYEVIMTNKYSPTDPHHRKLKAQLLVSGDISLSYFTILGDAVALRVECRTNGRGFIFRSGTAGATTLGKLFTPLCLCHQAR